MRARLINGIGELLGMNFSRLLRQIGFLLITVSLLGGVSIAEANTPTDSVRTTIEKARATVKSDKGKVSEEQLAMNLEQVILPVFDFDEMSRRSLGANWSKGTPEQQKEFVELFSKLLSRTYRNQVMKGIDTSIITYDGESLTDGSALVKTSVQSEGDKFKVVYRLRKQADTWRVYDVVIENVGLVTNYRNEFAGIIRKDGFPGLIDRLKTKQAEPRKAT